MSRILILAVLGFNMIGTHSNNLMVENKVIDPATWNLSWQETSSSLSLLNNGEVVWQLNYDKSEDKPYFYPLRTLNGIDLALKRPDDHPWHRGLWFSWKYINGVNYWEEDPESGLAPGRSLIEKIELDKNLDYSATVKLVIHYAPEGKNIQLIEHRTLFISSPDEQGNYYIDWYHTFTAQKDQVILDRTPPQKHGGPIWGGYSGISFRANVEDLDINSFRYLDSNGWVRNSSLIGYGKDARWMDLSGKVSDNDTSIQSAGVAIFDHPDNPRHPSAWYVWFNRNGSNGPSDSDYNHAFFSPAFLYNSQYELPSDSSFKLQYRVLVHEVMLSQCELNNEYRKYIQ